LRFVYKRQEDDWFWKEDKAGTQKGHRSRLKRSEQQDKKMNLLAASCVKMTQARSTVQDTKGEKIAATESQRTDVWTGALTRSAPWTFSRPYVKTSV